MIGVVQLNGVAFTLARGVLNSAKEALLQTIVSYMLLYIIIASETLIWLLKLERRELFGSVLDLLVLL